MEFAEINWLAAVIAAVAFFAVGGIWYGPLFGKRWMAASGVTEEQAQESNMPLLFGGTLVLELIAAVGLGALIGAGASAVDGLMLGLAVALLLVIPALSVLALYERRAPVLWALNAGYNLLGFALMGTIIGAMQ